MNRLETPKTIRITAAVAAAITTFTLLHEVAMLAQPSEAQTRATMVAHASVPATQSATASK